MRAVKLLQVFPVFAKLSRLQSTMTKALVILSEGAEEMETVISVDVLRRGGVNVIFVSNDLLYGLSPFMHKIPSLLYLTHLDFEVMSALLICWLIKCFPQLEIPQALEVMAINHKNNASNKCLRSNTVSMAIPTVLLCRHYCFRAYFNDLW